jgi:hypothetical protein
MKMLNRSWSCPARFAGIIFLDPAPSGLYRDGEVDTPSHQGLLKYSTEMIFADNWIVIAGDYAGCVLAFAPAH